MEFVTPPPVAPGDRIAVVAPSSGGARAAPEEFERGLDRLRGLGVEPVVFPTARQGDEFLRDHPEARAADLHAAFRDPDVSAVFATIGGDDQIRVLNHLDPATLRANPTRFFGMSDNTNLACLLWEAGVVSYYGGQLLNQVAPPGPLHAFSKRYLRRALFEESLGELDAADEWADLTAGFGEYADADPGYRPAPGWTWTGGDQPVEGRLWGGCLVVLAWQLMTGRVPDERLDGSVLLLETAEDLPSAKQVRWTLTCMGERGLLDRFDAALVGRPATANWRERPEWAEREAYRKRQRETIRDAFDRYNPDAPVVFDVDVGHTNPTAPLPVGGRVKIGPRERRIAFR